MASLIVVCGLHAAGKMAVAENLRYKAAVLFCACATIGLGDISAVSDLERIISVIPGIFGIIVVALITSIIVNFYGEIKKDRTGQETDLTVKD